MSRAERIAKASLRRGRGAAPLALLIVLAACGDLPRPFQGSPGSVAMQLRKPPPARLSVVAPTEALLAQEPSDLLAGDVVEVLVANELPAVTGRDRKGEWRLVIKASSDASVVTPHFSTISPKGEVAGTIDGDPVPLALWGEAQPEMLKKVADAAAPKIMAMLRGVDATARQSDPNSLYNRPAKVFVASVDGAPGDGDAALTRQMREQLATLGPVVQDTPRNADFAVEGHVATAPGAGNTTRIEVQWVVRDGADERGRIVQLNEVPPGSLDRFWGDVAVVVAREAAGGVRDVILTQSGRRGGPNAVKPSEAAPESGQK